MWLCPAGSCRMGKSISSTLKIVIYCVFRIHCGIIINYHKIQWFKATCNIGAWWSRLGMVVLIVLVIHLVPMSPPAHALTDLAQDDSLLCLHSSWRGGRK